MWVNLALADSFELTSFSAVGLAFGAGLGGALLAAWLQGRRLGSSLEQVERELAEAREALAFEGKRLRATELTSGEMRAAETAEIVAALVGAREELSQQEQRRRVTEDEQGAALSAQADRLALELEGMRSAGVAVLDARGAELGERAGALEQRERALAEREQAHAERVVEAELAAAAAAVAAVARPPTLAADLAEPPRLDEEARAARLAGFDAELEAGFDDALARRAERLELDARSALASALARLPLIQGAERCVTEVEVPSEVQKRRLIGREGRNARAFQRATGADLVIDDSPGVVSVSCFDPLRRDLAARALSQLFAGGAIHPARIEELVLGLRSEVDERVARLGFEASEQAGVTGLPAELGRALGRLAFTTSGGQSVLAHSVEVSLLSGQLAAELGLDVEAARRAGLLHDVGRASQHELELDHGAAGAALLERHGEGEALCALVAAHHEAPSASLEAAVLRVANQLSGERPGARSEPIERHLRRLQAMEELALEHSGVERAFVFEAGRRVEVLVRADQVSARALPRLSRDIARRLGAELAHPGPVEVEVIRETVARERIDP